MPETVNGFGRRIFGGASWFVATRLLVQVLQLASGIALARLLSPADFGSFASVSVIVGFAVILVEGGLTSALIHLPEPTQSDFSTVFSVNALGGVVLAVLLWASAPLVAGFYGNQELITLTPVVGLTFAFSLAVAHRAIAIRSMRFRLSATIDSAATACGLAVTLLLAVTGAGAISLAIGPVVAQLLGSLAYAKFVKWRPTSFIRLSSLRPLLAYSAPLVGATTAEYWGRNADNLLVGRFLGATTLGFYNRAYNLMSMPVTQATNAIGNAVSPGLARLMHDPARVGKAYTSTLIAMSCAVVPAMAGLAYIAPDLVPLLWGDLWSPATPILQVLCLAAVPQCLSTTATWLYQAEGRTKTMLYVTLSLNVLAIVGMLFSVQVSAIAVAWTVFVRYSIGAPFEIAIAARNCGLDVTRFLRSFFLVLLATGLMILSMYLAKHLTEGWASKLEVVLIVFCFGSISFVLASVILLRSILTEVMDLMRGRK